MPDREPRSQTQMGWPLPLRELKRLRFFDLLYYVLRFGLAGVFILAGSLKLRNLPAFAQALSQYQLIPEPFLPWLAVGLPVVEVLAGVGLIFNFRGSLGAITGMLIVFLGVLGYAIVNELDIDCGCFTLEEMAERVSVTQAFYRDLFLLAGALFLFWWQRLRRLNHFNQ
jgi:uncharacterized membrane protein YphA (DoxX/SURF4 family)